MALTADMVQLLDAGVAHWSPAARTRRPWCRVWPHNFEADGRLVVIISSLSGFEVLDAGRETGRVAVNAAA
jgi:hypothetical protein